MENDPTFPTRLSDLHLPPSHQSLYTTLKTLKRTTLTLHNRLSSILIDSQYITSTLAPSFPSFPLVANERCGSWYIPPGLRFRSAYFKSTDGHYGAWAFSLRRLNLEVLEALGVHGGAVLVDSTRRGKRMPDALRRTVPVWVLVWNLVLFGGGEGAGGFGLQHPGLEEGEVRLIERRVGGWVEGLKGLGLDLDGLRGVVGRPIRCVWLVQGEEMPDVQSGDGEWNVLVLCSASRPVLGAEMSEDGYVQGAADDAEGWSGGLTAKMFWEYKDRLMAASEEELPDLLTGLIQEEKGRKGGIQAVRILPTVNLFVAAVSTGVEELEAAPFDLVVDCNSKPDSDSKKVVSLGCRSGKLGSRDLREKLSLAVNCVLEVLKSNADSRILVVCETGKDLSIGVVATILCLSYNDEGQLSTSQPAAVDKQLVKKRLAWITSVKPDANPSRSTLQAINSFLIQRPI